MPDGANVILFVPGKNPKPPEDAHRHQLLRCLVHGVERADPKSAEAIRAQPEHFQLIGWNALYYGNYKLVDEDRPWIEALLTMTGPTPEDVREALSWRRKRARLLYTLADWFPFLIELLPDPAVKSTIRETARYFHNRDRIASRVREQLKEPLRRLLDEQRRILLIGHSMGSVIAYDALWELTHLERRPGKVDLFLTLGSPLGMSFVQKRLLGAREQGPRRYPGNIGRWLNVAAQGDLTALDATLRDDFRPMLELGLIESLDDYSGAIFNYFRNAAGLNVHRSYGYLVNPRVGEIIARWWRGERRATGR
jgi:pimeloyl-ACP methyl ester carboxylesterase